jgi:hypothetical protein
MLFVVVVDAMFGEILNLEASLPVVGCALAYRVGGALTVLPALAPTGQVPKFVVTYTLELAALGFAIRTSFADRGDRVVMETSAVCPAISG